MLAGHSEKKLDITVKWDGAPAIFAGIDPRDKKFFIAKKGVFNKTPQLFKTHEDIDNDPKLPSGLNATFHTALDQLSKLGIKNVIQGDLMYTKKSLKNIKHEGESYISFHPNTIVYIIPKASNLGKQIRASQMGIVWHTVYRGKKFESMKASFGENISGKLKKTKGVWHVDATYRDLSGKATMTAAETASITAVLSRMGKVFSKLDAKVLNGIKENSDLLMKIKVYNNKKVRDQKQITNTSTHVDGLVDFIFDDFQKKINAVKTDAAKEKKKAERDKVLGFFGKNNKAELKAIFDLYNLTVEAKEMVIQKLDQAKEIDTLLKTKDGYKVTGQEGFVAIDKFTGNAVKLVDRMAFSHANFSDEFVKGWQ